MGARIQQALDGLPPEYRLLLLLISDKELSYEQAGALTGQTADAVRGKLFRARKAFGAKAKPTKGKPAKKAGQKAAFSPRKGR